MIGTPPLERPRVAGRGCSGGVVPTPEPPRRLSMESALSRIELVGQRFRDPHRRRPFQCRAMRVQRRPVQDSITCSTMPAGVPATAVSDTGDMTNEDLVGAERVLVGAASRRVDDPSPGRGLCTSSPTQHGAYAAAPYAISYIPSRRPGSRRRIDRMTLVPCSARRCCCGPSPMPRTC